MKYIFISFPILLFALFVYVYSIEDTIVYVAEVREVPIQVVVEPIEYVLAEITAYTSDVGETDDTPFITASGSTVDEETVACPSKYEFGTEVKIDGKVYVCKDRMNARYRDGDYFDVWFANKSLAYEFGRQVKKVVVLSN